MPTGAGERRQAARWGSVKPDLSDSYREYRSQLWNYFRRCGATGDQAEDLVQSVFVVLMENFGKFDRERGSLKGFLFGIARNLRHSWERDIRYGARLAGRLQAEEAPPDELREQDLAIRAAVAQLAEEPREALVLREFHGLSYNEIAQVQGVEVGTIRSRLFRAREQLREMLKGS